MKSTPFFPQWRARLAALGLRASHSVRQFDLLALSESFRDLFPPPLLASPDEGPGSRDRLYSLRLTFQCFVWQMLKPRTSCREVVRAVQGLFQSQGWGPVDERPSPYVQARQRLPEERLAQALEITAQYRCQFSLFKLSCFLLAPSRLETCVQLPMARCSAIHLRLMVVSCRIRTARRTFRSFPLLARRKAARSHPKR